MRPTTTGIAIWTATATFEIWAARHKPQWTLSCYTRWALHTDTTTGRAVFLVLWAPTTIWITRHILEVGGMQPSPVGVINQR